MVCLGVKPGAAGWKAQTNPLCYGGTLNIFQFIQLRDSGPVGVLRVERTQVFGDQVLVDAEQLDVGQLNDAGH